MKNLILVSIIASALISLMFVSCTKEINNPVIIKYDTVRITTHDTVKIITNNHDTVIIGMDSVKMAFVYTMYFVADSSLCSIKAADNSQNIPSDAVYTFKLIGQDQQWYIGKSYSSGYLNNGDYIISENIYIPGTKKNYTIAKPFIVKLKKI